MSKVGNESLLDGIQDDLMEEKGAQQQILANRSDSVSRLFVIQLNRSVGCMVSFDGVMLWCSALKPLNICYINK